MLGLRSQRDHYGQAALLRGSETRGRACLDHWSHKGLYNRAENSHLPFRKRERVMQGFRSPGSLQRFVSMQSATRNSSSATARRRSALTIRYHRLEAFEA